MSEKAGDSAERAAVGTRLKQIRTKAGLTIRQAAAGSRLDKNTILAIEQGRSVRFASLAKLGDFYGVLPPAAVTPGEGSSEAAVLHDPGKAAWLKLSLSQEESPSLALSSTLAHSAEARSRMGLSGLASQFFQRMASRPHGSLRSAVFEVYSSSGWSSQPSGEAMIYLLDGRAKFSIGSQEFILEKGFAITFDRRIRHRHEPLPPQDGAQPFCRLLYIQTD